MARKDGQMNKLRRGGLVLKEIIYKCHNVVHTSVHMFEILNLSFIAY